MKVIINAILGLIAGIYLCKLIFKRPIYHGPNSSKIKRHRYYLPNGKCYRFKPVPYICPLKMNIK